MIMEMVSVTPDNMHLIIYLAMRNKKIRLYLAKAVHTISIILIHLIICLTTLCTQLSAYLPRRILVIIEIYINNLMNNIHNNKKNSPVNPPPPDHSLVSLSR